MMRPTTPLTVHFVPYRKAEPVNDAVDHLRPPYLIAAEKAAMQQSVVVLPRQRQYGGRIDSLTRVRATTTEHSRTSARYGVPIVAYCPTFKGLQLAQEMSGGVAGCGGVAHQVVRELGTIHGRGQCHHR